MALHPSGDPTCRKYIDDPGRRWYANRWRTPEQIQKLRENQRQWYGKQAHDSGYRERKRERERGRAYERYANDPVYRNKNKMSVLKSYDRKRREMNVAAIIALRTDGGEDDPRRDWTDA